MRPGTVLSTRYVPIVKVTTHRRIDMIETFHGLVSYARAFAGTKVRNPRAATMLEYVLIAGIVMGVAAGIFATFKTTIRGWFESTGTGITGANGAAAPR
jgi:Flp pilus assembly pilin Flp